MVCPACRGPHGAQGLDVVDDDVLGCACEARYPVVDGIPLVFRDLDAWLASEGVEALRRHDLPSGVDRILTRGAGGSLARNAALVAAYAEPQACALRDWLARVGATLGGSILEVGSGCGALGRSDVVAVDHNLALLRRHPSRLRLCADAGDPPFVAESFDAVVLANVLDSCADPALVLAQAQALVRPGGVLVVTCAFAFNESVTPRARWFDAAWLGGALRGTPPRLAAPAASSGERGEDASAEGGAAPGAASTGPRPRRAPSNGGREGGGAPPPHESWQIEEETPDLTWAVRVNERLVQSFRVDAWIVRKDAALQG